MRDKRAYEISLKMVGYDTVLPGEAANRSSVDLLARVDLFHHIDEACQFLDSAVDVVALTLEQREQRMTRVPSGLRRMVGARSPAAA